MVKPGYKQTEIGVLPEDWTIGYLSDFGKVQSGGTPSTTIADYWGGNIAWCTPSDITSTPIKYINSTQRTITDEGLKSSAAIVMPAGSILLCTRATIGELKINSIPMATNQGFKNITIDGRGNAEFFYYLLQTKKNSMLELAIGSTFLEISKTALCKIPLQIPIRDEQNRIADVLSDMDNLVVVLEKQIAKKKAIKQGAMQELLTGKRRLPGFSEKWEEKPIGFFGNFISGNCFPIEYQGCPRGELPFYKVSDFNNAGNSRVMGKANNYISHNIASVLSCKIIPKNSVVFAKIGAAISLERKRITGFDCCIDNNMMSFLPYQKNIAAYMCYLFQTIRFGEFVEATALPSLSGKTIGEIQRTFPPTVEEQIAIATVLSDLDSEIEALERKLTKYRQVKQGMMQQLLTGKIRLV